MAVGNVKKTFETVFGETDKVIVGQKHVMEQIVIAMLANGNALLESYPGLAKTLAIKTLAEILDLKFARIQFTPDLAPSDITGTYVLEDSKGERKFKFEPGPIFTNLLLADEINRATPKTQSALLEAMQEKQVTVGNSTFKLDEPFLVMATQNPIEQEGSLALDQSVFYNGTLVKGEELLSEAKNSPIIEKDGKKLYLTNGWTFSLDTDGRIKKKSCYVYELPYDDQLYTFKLRTGREISVTRNHPFFVFSNGALMWKRADEINMKDYLISPAALPEGSEQIEIASHEQAVKILANKYDHATSTQLNSLQTKSKNFVKFENLSFEELNKIRIALQKTKKELAKDIGLDTKEYWQLIRFFRGRNNDSEIRKKIENYFIENAGRIDVEKDYFESWKTIGIRNKPTDEKIAAWLGCLLSDGSITKNVVCFTQKNYKSTLSLFKDVLKKDFGIEKVEIIEKEGGDTDIVVRSEIFSEYLRIRYGIDPQKKQIPSWFVSMPKDMRKAFLKHFNALEGHIKDNRITITQKNKESINVLSYLLLKEGIVHKLIDDNRVMRISIQGDSSKYIKNIGWLEDVPTIKDNDQNKYCSIPIHNELIKVISELNFDVKEERTKHSWYNAVRSIKSGRDKLSSESYKQLLGALKKEATQQLVSGELEILQSMTARIDYLQKLADCNVIYDEIESITSRHYEGSVFGLTVPDLQNYIGGFGGCGINHNTYPLPEAQSDRFLLKIKIGYPSVNDEVEIVNRYTESLDIPSVKRVLAKNNILQLQKLTRQVPIANDLKKYAVNIVTSTRNAPKYIEYGASPRASIGLVVAAKARALLYGRTHVSREDIQAMAFPILRHRIILTFEAEREKLTHDEIIKRLL